MLSDTPNELPGEHGDARPADKMHARAPREISSEQLLGDRGELKIAHNGEFYSLRRTRQGKLILTK